MALPVTVVESGGLPVMESAADSGLPVTPTGNATAVTIVAGLGLPVTFIGEDGVLWPGGVEPE